MSAAGLVKGKRVSVPEPIDDQSDDTGSGTVVHLASGASVQVVDGQVVVRSSDADRAPDVTDIGLVKNVTRVGDEVTITRVRRRTMQIALTSEDDAVRLEAAVQAALGGAVAAQAGQGLTVAEAGTRWRVIGMLICAVLIVVGSIGPWVEVAGTTIWGIEGDGSLTIIFGLIAAGLATMQLLGQAQRQRGWVLRLLFLAFALTAAVGLIDWVDLGRTIDGVSLDARVGWGLPLMTVGGGIGSALAIGQYLRRPRGRTVGRTLQVEPKSDGNDGER
jgi:hypothetical protein